MIIRKRHEILITILGLVWVILVTKVNAASEPEVSFVYRWNVTEINQSISPPLELLWNRTPLWFGNLSAGGMFESLDRRIVDTPEGFVTVMKKTLYMLDKQNGKTLWSLPLQGDEISDWKIVDHIFVYASSKGSPANINTIRAGIDLLKRAEIWSQSILEPKRFPSPEWLVVSHNSTVIYGTNYDSEYATFPLVALDPNNGKENWSVPKGLPPLGDVPSTWFVYGNKLYDFVHDKIKTGTNLQSYDLETGRKGEWIHIYGDIDVGNLFRPFIVKNDGTLFSVYHTLGHIRGPNGFYPTDESILAFNLKENKLLWSTQVIKNDPRLVFVKQLVKGQNEQQPLIATIRPNYFVLLDPLDGTILKQDVLPGYVGWTEHAALLYSYPYLYTGARRTLTKGMAHDLIALNLKTGKVDWSYELGKERDTFLMADSEILNFIVLEDKIYLSRADGHVMAFQAHISP